MNDDSLRAVLEKCAYEGELWKPDELLPMQNIAQELYDSLAIALARLDEYEQSFRLYNDACHRGTKMWQEATGDKHTWPDTAKLVAWLLARLEALSPEAAYMAGCMLALWFATSPKASGVRVAEALFRFAMLGGHDDAKEQLAALAREEIPHE